MKRLVYSPKVDVYVKADSGIYDISPYVVNCSVDRKVGQVSQATVTFRNPEFMWTKAKIKAQDGSLQEGPVFHPQDPIIVTMTRLFNHPVQVFTGYCDTTPYLQLFPGPCVIEASCTLKRLLYRFWDPGLPFSGQYINSISGWVTVPGQGVMNPSAEQAALKGKIDLTDGSIGNLLKHILIDIGGWDENNIYIEAIPPKLGDIVVNLFNEINSNDAAAQAELKDFLTHIVGSDNQGTSSMAPDPSGGVGGVVGTGQFQSCLLTWYDPALGGTNSASGLPDPHSLTASGEPYDATKLTCAAPPNYKFGTYLEFKVGKSSCICKVNDRGGAIQGSHFDLSRAAAEVLGVLQAGRANGQFRLATNPLTPKPVGKPLP